MKNVVSFYYKFLRIHHAGGECYHYGTGIPSVSKMQYSTRRVNSKRDLFNCEIYLKRDLFNCTNQQPPQRGGAVPDPVWVGSKWLLAFPRVPVTPGTPLLFFAMLPPERTQEGSTQHLKNRSPVFSFSSLLPYSCPSSSPHSSSSPDER